MNKHFCLVVTIYFFCSPENLFSQSIDSTLHSGNWSDTAIWSNGIPSSTDYIVINHRVYLDMDVTTLPPGKLFISGTGELCGNYNFTGSFIHYGPFMVNYIHATYDSSFSYNQYAALNGCSVTGTGTVWHTEPPGYGCCGCPFTCNPIIPWQAPVADFSSNTTICAETSVQFTDLSKNYPSTWLWTFPGGTPSTSNQQNPVIAYYQPGIYDVTLIAGNSIGSDTITKQNYITVLSSPTVTISSDVTITYGGSVNLLATGGESYLWNNGLSDSEITVSPTETTVYCVTVTNTNNCSNTKCVVVTFDDICRNGIYLPNAFSPNSDNENDFLQIYFRDVVCIKSFHIIVYNRLGEKVFETTDFTKGWDGTYQNKQLNADVFTWYLEAILISGTVIRKKGNITLLR